MYRPTQRSRAVQSLPRLLFRAYVAAANVVELLETEHREVAELFDTFESAEATDELYGDRDSPERVRQTSRRRGRNRIVSSAPGAAL